MKRIKEFFKTTLIGGFIVILPVALLFAVFKGIFNFITKLIKPFTDLLVEHSDLMRFIADLVVLIIIFSVCFIIGYIVKTNLGKWMYNAIEKNLLKKFPGYKLIKETVLQLLGNESSPFSSVALVNIFENETRVTAFITEEHADGSFTVFVPTGPNPTSGNIYHVKKQYVTKTDADVEDAMKSIISCGAGSSKIIKSINNK